ncbi:MAG: hypothetical protein HC771_02195 [Synechococcales cyanobacterium CRU_2_2]|nr:hypothetical protein [Synechococcales cyanobacterium CRU_2_2]
MVLGNRLAENESVSLRSPLANLLVLGAGIGLLYWSYQYLQTRMTSVISVDAVVNGALVDLKAPEDGILEPLVFRTGDAISKAAPVFRITNSRASEVKGQELLSRLRQQQFELTGAQSQLLQKQKMLSFVSQDASEQITLEGSEMGLQIQQLESELQGGDRACNSPNSTTSASPPSSSREPSRPLMSILPNPSGISAPAKSTASRTALRPRK